MTRKVMRRAVLSSAAMALLLGACASNRAARPSAPAAPEAPAASHTYGRTTAPIACVPDPGNTDLHRRQYCDKRKRRFYFFDPDHKQYFWENGQPKG